MHSRYRNLLIQRLQKHRQMPILFRFGQAGGEESAPPPATGAEPALAAPVVIAHLLTEQEALPEGYRINPPTGAGSATEPVVSPTQRQIAPTQPASRPVPAPVPLPPAPVTKASAEPSADSTSSDTDWQRLKAIHRKHQETKLEKGDDASVSPAAQRPASQQKASQPTTPAPSQQEPRRALPPRPGAVENLPQPNRKADRSVPKTVEATRVETEPIKIPPVQSPTSRGDFNPTVGLDAETTVQHPSRPETGFDPTTTADQPAAAQSGQPGDRTGTQHAAAMLPAQLSDLPEAEEADLPFTAPLQAVPLQSVWPVIQQMNMSEDERADSKSDQRAAADQAPMQWNAETSALEIAQARIRQVAPAQPTESHVEIVPPRKPRPAAPLTVSQDASLVQRKPLPSKEVAVEQPADEIETPIGPLPGDLWDLIGQSRPGSSSPAQGVVNHAPADQPKASPQPQPAERAAGKADLPTAHQPTVIQRKPVEETSFAQEEAVQEQVDEEAESEALNVDELVDLVYEEIRRRLAAEKELRHRFS